MIDYRKNIITAMDVNDSNIKQLLTSIGVQSSTQDISDIIKYLNNNKLKLTMSNLLKALKYKSLISIKDCRTIIADSKVVVLNYIIKDIESFDKNMNELGYENFTNNFLSKNIDDIKINISRNSEEIQAITGYDQDNRMLTIPDDILNNILDDINKSNE